jgi:microtubule-associated protein, RP/EB family
MGRHELLEWINRQMQTEYTSVEALSDGVAYSQVIDAIHPGSINIFKLNLSTKYPEDNYRNIKLIEDALKKLKITQPLSF